MREGGRGEGGGEGMVGAERGLGIKVGGGGAEGGGKRGEEVRPGALLSLALMSAEDYASVEAEGE